MEWSIETIELQMNIILKQYAMILTLISKMIGSDNGVLKMIPELIFICGKDERGMHLLKQSGVYDLIMHNKR